MKRLNFGCGSIQPTDWDNVDLDPQYNAKLVLPVETYDYVVAHHVIQQWTHHQVIAGLGQLRTILKPNGILRLSVPDCEAGFLAFRRGDDAWFPIHDDVTISEKFSRWLTWYGENRICFTEAYLHDVCIDAGFMVAVRVDFQKSFFGAQAAIGLDTRKNESIFMECKR